MARTKRAVAARKSHKKILKAARGYSGSRSRHYRAAHEQVMHARADAYRDRRSKKRDFRRLWITRINAAARQHGMTYSRLMAGLKSAEIEVNRKMLAELAVRQPQDFARLVEIAANH